MDNLLSPVSSFYFLLISFPETNLSYEKSLAEYCFLQTDKVKLKKKKNKCSFATIVSLVECNGSFQRDSN